MKFVLALDLIENPALITEYEKWHQPENANPDVIHHIRKSGITSMEIYRVGNRLTMLLETDSSFSFERKEKMDSASEVIQAWEQLMWKFQQPLPFAEPGEKWIAMNKIFDLNHVNAKPGELIRD